MSSAATTSHKTGIFLSPFLTNNGQSWGPPQIPYPFLWLITSLLTVHYTFSVCVREAIYTPNYMYNFHCPLLYEAMWPSFFFFSFIHSSKSLPMWKQNVKFFPIKRFKKNNKKIKAPLIIVVMPQAYIMGHQLVWLFNQTHPKT